MSAIAPWRWSPWPVLRSCAPAWARWFACVASALLLGIVAVAGVGESAGLAIVMCVLSVALVWMLWFWKLLLLHLEARASRMPALARGVGIALASAWLVTVALPAVFLVGAGIAPVTALSTLTLAAAGGMLVFLLPRGVLILFCCLPLLLTVARSLFARPMEALPWLQGSWSWETAQLPWLATGAVVLVAGCWHICLRWAEGATAWWQPLALAQLQLLKTPDVMVTGYAEPWRQWAWLQGGLTHVGPETPVRAMRSLIGGTFMPLRGHRLWLDGGLWLLGCACVLLGVGSGSSSVVLTGLLIACCVLPMAYGQRLEMLYRQQARELDELALLPGWGCTLRARATLLRATIWPPTFLWLALLALVLLGAYRSPQLPANAYLLVLVMVNGALLMLLCCLRPLAGLQTSNLKSQSILGPGIAVSLAGAVYSMHARVGQPGIGMLFGVLLLAAIAYALALLATWRRFLQRPHPFLQG